MEQIDRAPATTMAEEVRERSTLRRLVDPKTKAVTDWAAVPATKMIINVIAQPSEKEPDDGAGDDTTDN